MWPQKVSGMPSQTARLPMLPSYTNVTFVVASCTSLPKRSDRVFLLANSSSVASISCGASALLPDVMRPALLSMSSAGAAVLDGTTAASQSPKRLDRLTRLSRSSSVIAGFGRFVCKTLLTGSTFTCRPPLLLCRTSCLPALMRPCCPITLGIAFFDRFASATVAWRICKKMGGISSLTRMSGVRRQGSSPTFGNDSAANAFLAFSAFEKITFADDSLIHSMNLWSNWLKISSICDVFRKSKP
mmetsp:Transcript_82768/g.208367  ORF Transcript_82768/g.208367 Transcript_82768/m.208367 type:complete len:243 (+) Transcript_82768:181-909(+)